MSDQQEAYRSRPQSQPGSRKPTQQAYGVGRTMRHISFDNPTSHTLNQALEILSSEDRISIGLLVRRAVQLYGASLAVAHPERIEAKREAVRKGARKSKVNA